MPLVHKRSERENVYDSKWILPTSYWWDKTFTNIILKKRKVLLQSCYIHISYDFLTFEIMAKSVYSTKLIGDTHSNMIINVLSKLKFWCFVHTRKMLWFLLWKKSPIFKSIIVSKFCYIVYFFIGLFCIFSAWNMYKCHSEALLTSKN